MGLGKERFFSSQRSPEHLAPLPQNGVFYRENIPIPNSQEQRRLGEVRIKLKEQGERELQRDLDRLGDRNDFEPFTNPSNDGEDQFVNNYTGNFWENMMLNRRAVERVLEIAHLDGQVFLSSRGSLPKNPIEANSDGSVTAKRTLSFEQKKEEEGRENPFYRVESIPQGWNIVVNDKGITGKVEGKGLSGSTLREAFVKRFNDVLKDGLFESIRREKLSSEKDRDFSIDLFISVLDVLWGSFVNFRLLSINTPIFLSGSIFTTLILFGFSNLGSRSSGRKSDSKWEWFMPPVEIDKVARAFIFLKGKGQKLVKERDPEINSG